MRIALAQINSILGDFQANKDKILDYIARAEQRHCDLVVFPRRRCLATIPWTCSSGPQSWHNKKKSWLKSTKKFPKGWAFLSARSCATLPKRAKAFGTRRFFYSEAQSRGVFAKQLLPTYDVFDESRHIEPGQVAKNIFKFKGQRILVTVCEDIWAWPLKGNPWYSKYGKNPLQEVKRSSVDLVVNKLSASPFTQTKFANRRAVTKNTVALFSVNPWFT